MRSFKNFITEKVEPARGIKPKAGDEAAFMDKHVVDVVDDPHMDKETREGTKKSPAKKKRLADNDQASAEAAYESMDPVGQEDDDVDNDGDSDEADDYLKNRRKSIKKKLMKKEEVELGEMSDAQMKKREEIVMSMKDKAADFKKRYGDKWKNVMYATATKAAMKEEVKLDEARRGRPRKDGSSPEGSEGTENIQMQLRKSVSMNGNKDVEFHDGKKVKVSAGMARQVLGKINGIRQAKDKQNASRYIAKSYANLQAFAAGKEKGMDPEVEKQKILKLKMDEAAKPYVSSDKDGKHVMNSSGKIHKSFKDMESANTYLKRNYNKLMKEEVELDEAYKAGNLKLKDGSQVKLTSEDAKIINSLYKNLNASNRKQMEQRMMKDKKSFGEIVAFAKETM